MITEINGTIINMSTYLNYGSKEHPALIWMTNIYNKEEMKYCTN